MAPTLVALLRNKRQPRKTNGRFPELVRFSPSNLALRASKSNPARTHAFSELTADFWAWRRR
jgi:hypothetical protein